MENGDSLSRALEAGAAEEARWDGRDLGGMSRADKQRYVDRFSAAVTACLATLGHESLEKLRSEVVFGFYEEEYPLFAQGYERGAHELSSPVTAQECDGYVDTIKRLRAQLEET